MKLALVKRQERAALVEKARAYDDAMNAKCRAESRGPTAEEQSPFDAMMADVDKLAGEITSLEKIDTATDERRGRLDALEAGLRTPAHEMSHRPQAIQPIDTAHAARMVAFRGALRNEGPGRGDLHHEFRAHQADNSTAGGYLVQPDKFQAELIKAVDDMTFMRRICRVLQMTEATELSIPTRTARLNDADWTQEITAAAEDTAMTFGRRKIKPHPLSKLVKMSNPLLRLSAIPAEQMLRDELAYTFAITMEKGFLTGTGAGSPLGIFTANAAGVSTDRDISTDNTTTNVTADGLWNAFYHLKPQYQAKAVTVAGRTFAKNVRKLKLGSGEYIWSPGINSAQPDMIFNRPFYQSEYAPSTWTTGLYVAAIFDPAAYYIAETLSLDVTILRELYAVTNQTGFIGRAECDGQPVLEEAFARVKLA